MKKQLSKNELRKTNGGVSRCDLDVLACVYHRSSEEGKRAIMAEVEQLGLKDDFVRMVNLVAPLFRR